MITDYHAKLFAHELSKRYSVADAEKPAGTFDAQVDLNPHQVEEEFECLQTEMDSKINASMEDTRLGQQVTDVELFTIRFRVN